VEEEAVLGRILIVDDDRSLLTILSELLSKNYAVSTCASGREALDYLAANTADLVLLDIMMPEMDGFEVCAAIKADAAIADTPIMFITGTEDEDAEEAALDAGGVDFISKPVKPRIVESRVHLQMQNHLYLQFLEKMLEEKSLTIEALRSKTRTLLDAIDLTAAH
jgi:putative two-component system response regulator